MAKIDLKMFFVQTPMMSLAPIANAMQQYQQQWLSQYQQVIKV